MENLKNCIEAIDNNIEGREPVMLKSVLNDIKKHLTDYENILKIVKEK